MTDKTKYEQFYEDANVDLDKFKSDAHADGIYTFTNSTLLLQKLQHHMNHDMLVNRFGEQLGGHLWEKFVYHHNRNLLSWLSKLTAEYRFFIIYELKKGRICS